MTQAISSQGWVAGQSADGHGILTGWHGRQDMTREQLIDVATVADIPREWLPSVKDAAVQLGRAVQYVAGGAYIAKPVRKGNRLNDDGTQITWDARWVLVTRPTGNEAQAGETYGVVALVATLYAGDNGPQLTFERNQQDERTLTLAAAVSEQFERRIASQRYTAADVTKWLGDTLRRRLGAVRYGGNYYVPRETRDLAEVLLATVRETGWGTNWLYPPLPVATSPQLSLGLALGLQSEVDDVMAQLETQRKVAREMGRSDIGHRAAESFIAKLNIVSQRVNDKAELLGPGRVTETNNAIFDAMIVLDELLGRIQEYENAA